MRNHYVPRQYLRGFCEPGSDRLLWQFDKHTNQFKRVSIKTAGIETDFYPAEVEQLLATQIEGPANSVLEKLRSQKPICDEERVRLSIYVATMLKRVPHSRQKARTLIPPALSATIEEAKHLLETEAVECNVPEEIKRQKLAEVDAIGERFRLNPPPQVMEQIMNPWPWENVVAHIFSMTWRFLTAEGPSFFVTSDNPAFYFDFYGLSDERVELVLPISTTLALHASWQNLRPSENAAQILRQFLVRELNRRLVHMATRFVYYHEEKDWIRQITLRNEPHLNRILF